MLQVSFLLARLKGSPRPGNYRLALQVRSILESRGGLWIKMGQLLATRRDLFVGELCDQLEHLQDRAAGFPGEEAKAIVAAELDSPLADVFSSFGEEPVAAASVSQIHRARLRHGDAEVAVKVLRPNIERIFKRDLRLMQMLAAFIDAAPGLRHLHLREMVSQLDDILIEETDLRIEAGSMLRMRKVLAPHPGVYVGRVYPKHCTRQVLVMEWIDGLVLSAFMDMQNKDPLLAEEWLERHETDLHRVARQLYFTVQRQIYEDNLFHGDLHPGNIILLSRNKFALIDFGSVGTLDNSLRRRLLLYQDLLNAGDVSRAMAVFLSLSSPLPSVDIDKVVRELTQAYQNTVKVTSSPAFSLSEKANSDSAARQSQILNKYNIPVCWDFLRISRTMTTLQASLHQLDPGIDYYKLAFAYAKGRRRRENSSRRAQSDEGLAQTLAAIRDLVIDRREVVLSAGGPARFVPARRLAATAVAARALLPVFHFFGLLLLLAFASQHLGRYLPSAVTLIMRHASGFIPSISITGWVVIAVFFLLIRSSLRRLECSQQQSETP